MNEKIKNFLELIKTNFINNKKIKNKYLIILIVLPLILKLVLAFIVPGHAAVEGFSEWGDVDTFRKVTGVLLEGKNPFRADVDPYPHCYGPLFFLLFLINGIITVVTGLPFHFVIKIFPILAESVISILLFIILNRRYSIKKSFYWSLIFALNPATLSVSAIHGQFDALPILAMVLSYYFFLSKNKKIKLILPAICLGIGASFKFYPLLLMPVLFFKYKNIKEKLSFALIAIASYLITYTPFIISGDFFTAIKKPFEYTPKFNWGIAKFFLLLDKINISSPSLQLIENILTDYGKFILLIALVVTILIYSKVRSLGKSYRATFYCIYVFGFFMHPQYLTWIIPFLFLKIDFKELFYLIPVTGHIYFVYMIQLIGGGLGIAIDYPRLFGAPSFIFGILTWVFCIWMYFSYLKDDIKNIQFKRIFSIKYWLE